MHTIGSQTNLTLLHLPRLPFCCHPQASDEVSSLCVMTLKHKLRSFAFSPAAPRKPGCSGTLALGLANNSVEVVELGAEGGYEVSSRLELAGHRSDVRCLALSSDDMQVGLVGQEERVRRCC